MELRSREEADTSLSPWVMRFAWNKALHWYSSGEWADAAELVAWRAEPRLNLTDLAARLAAGTDRPPYSRKQGRRVHKTLCVNGHLRMHIWGCGRFLGLHE